jgi:hypothetical protein
VEYLAAVFVVWFILSRFQQPTAAAAAVGALPSIPVSGLASVVAPIFQPAHILGTDSGETVANDSTSTDYSFEYTTPSQVTAASLATWTPPEAIHESNGTLISNNQMGLAYWTNPQANGGSSLGAGTDNSYTNQGYEGLDEGN